jgi:hypothetical protein
MGGFSNASRRLTSVVLRGVTVATLAAMTGLAAAQESEYRQVSSPFQQAYAYFIGDELEPNAEIDGVRWEYVRVATRGDGEVQAGEENPIVVTLRFQSVRDKAARVQVSFLLEDARGEMLDRIQCEPFKVGGGRSKEVTERFDVMGDTLLATRGLYVSCFVD